MEIIVVSISLADLQTQSNKFANKILAEMSQFDWVISFRMISHFPLGKCHFISHTYLWYIFASIHPFGLPEDNFA
jgi:hypothetical protein